MIKRILLSLAVLSVFAFYAYQLKNNKSLQQLTIFKTPPPLPTTTPTPIGSTPVGAVATATPKGQYKDGDYTGVRADAFYGFVQVKAIVKGGKVVNVEFIEYPDDRQTSLEINDQAIPFLIQEAIIAQSAKVDGVTGATQTSKAFRQSLNSALNQAI